MARPREFDEDEVLERAMRAFWARGYEATSVSDLMEATGLAKGSVYKGFGDKRAFFLRALDMYLERGRARYRELDDGERPALDVLSDWLDNAVQTACGPGERHGCFAVNCTIELSGHDAEVRKRLQDHHRILEGQYAATLERGRRGGELRSDLETRSAARWLTTVIGGIQVTGKNGISRKDVATMARYGLDALRA